MKRFNILLITLMLFTNAFIIKDQNINLEKIEFNYKKTQNDDVIHELDKTIINTYDAKTNVLGQFATIAKINSMQELIKYSSVKIKPESVILYVDDNLNLVNEKKELINVSLKDAYENYIKGKMIPLIYISNDIQAENFINYYPYHMNILDMAVVSDNASLVKEVREVNTVIRGIIDYSKNDIDENDLGSIVKEVNTSYANTIIVNNKDATSKTIEYIQARLKTVWVETNEKDTLELLKNINNGVSGIVCNDTDYVYSATNVYLNTDNVLRNLNKKPYLIAHRGIYSNYENSLEGCVEAYNKGATHLEIDLQLTKDNRIAIMHDASIDRTTTGSGAISDYTYEELKNFKIDSSSEGLLEGEGVSIPLLDDFLNYFKDKDVVLVLEFKITNTKIVAILRELLEQYDAFDNVVLISFYPGILQEVKTKIPEVPLSTLGSISLSDFATGLEYINTKNSAVNTTKDNSYPDLTRYLVARGFAPWHWTYSDMNEVQKGFVLGVQGLTNDCIESFEYFAYKLYSKEEIIEVNSFDNLEVELNCLTYGKNECMTFKAKPLFIKIDGNKAQAIFYTSIEINYNENYSFCIFSDVLTLIKK